MSDAYDKVAEYCDGKGDGDLTLTAMEAAEIRADLDSRFAEQDQPFDVAEIWVSLEAEVERLRVDAQIRSEREQPENVWSTAKVGAYADCLDLIRAAKRDYERSLL